ncbi:MAG TPA: M35 family metallo-endopeptidase [Chitinophagaceae bacterium]|nr:M35 family metallo-endopeptidase [Chitinophagaceae bacterium]
MKKAIARNRRARKHSADGAAFFRQQNTKEGANFFAPGSSVSFFQPAIQRAAEDKHDLTSAKLSGNDELEATFDNERAIGRPAKGEHVKKLQEALITLGIPLPKFGADSDYGTETANGVKEFQKKAGMSAREQDGIVGGKTIGLMDMSLRNNNSLAKDEDAASDDLVVKDAKVKDDSCKNKPTDKPCPDPNTVVDKGAQDAIDLIDKVITTQLPPKKPEDGGTDYPAIFAALFRNNDNRDIAFTVNEVKTNYEEVKKFLGVIKKDKSHVRCGTDCDGGCRSGSPAYHNKENGKDIITFCPNFETHPNRTAIVLHESHHAAIAGSRDVAYPNTRLIDKLDHAKALLNAASFHLYAEFVQDPSTASMGPKTKDSNSIADEQIKKKADLVIAFIEQWFKLVTFDMAEISTEMDQARVKGFYPDSPAKGAIDRIYVPWLRVTPTYAKPTELDVKKAKAIQDRGKQMGKAFTQVLEISESTGVSLWERGPGKEIKLNKQVLSLGMERMAIALLQQLVHATFGISADIESLYVGVINDLRNERSLDP